MAFTLFPAIDLRDGQVIRLRQGDPAAQTVFGSDPAAVARRWAAAGAGWLHVVDLDAALSSLTTSLGAGALDMPANLRRLAEIRAAVDLPIQFGGGIRSLAAAARAFQLGATRVVLGTAAAQDPALVSEIVERFGPEHVVAGIDARAGQVAVHGWQETLPVQASDLARRLRAQGLQRAVYTDIARDGTLAGANVEATAGLARAGGLRVIASGGIASVADLRALAARAGEGIEGAVIGQALYTGAIDLAEAIAAVSLGDGPQAARR